MAVAATEISRIETEAEISSFLAKVRYALDNHAKIEFQIDRVVDRNRDIYFTNRFTIAKLFPDKDPKEALKSELKTLTVKEYLRTVKDIRFPKRSEMREFGRVYYGTADVYIKIRAELLDQRCGGEHTVFVMSFHYAEIPLAEEVFPYG